MDRAKIVVAEALSESALARLSAAGQVERLSNPDRASLIEAVSQADALVVRTYARVTEEVIAAARRTGRLKVIGRTGVGLDNIDVRAALSAGIQVVYTPAASTDAVADLVVGLIIAMQREIVGNESRFRAGEFAALRSGTPKAVELRHQTIGVIGMGRIGKAVGKRLSVGFGSRIVYYDIRDVRPLPFAAESCDSAESVYRAADVVTLHVPLTSRTRGMIDPVALGQFKKGAYLVNACRGPVVNAQALAQALATGQLAGAAVDVFDPEPPPPEHPLYHAPNCLLSPHVASRTREGIAAMNDVVDDVIRVLNGSAPHYPADPESLE